MKKSIRNIFIVTTMLLMTNPLAYAKEKNMDHDELSTKKDHAHSCFIKTELPKKEIQRAARKKLWTLTQDKKIDSSWLSVPIVSTNKQRLKFEVEWVIHFQNLRVKNKNKQNIYVVVDLYGHGTDASYTSR